MTLELIATGRWPGPAVAPAHGGCLRDDDPAGARLPGAAALLRARHPVRLRQGLRARWAPDGLRRPEDDVLGQLLPAFDGHGAAHLAAAAGGGRPGARRDRLPARQRTRCRQPGQPGLAAPRCRPGRPAAAHRRRPGGRPAGRAWATRRRASRAPWPSARPDDESPHARPWVAPPPTSCGRWASPSATRPSATWPSCPATSAWARAPSGRTRPSVGRHAAAADARPAGGRRGGHGQALPGLRRRRRRPAPPARASSMHRPGVLEARELAPFRAAIGGGRADGHVRPRGAAGRDRRPRAAGHRLPRRSCTTCCAVSWASRASPSPMPWT